MDQKMFNGFTTALYGTLKLAAAGLAVAGIAFGGLTAAGFRVNNPGDRLNQIETQLEYLTERQDAILRGHCVEWSSETIALSGLSRYCEELGIRK